MDKPLALKKIVNYLERPDVIKEPTVEELSKAIIFVLELVRAKENKS